MTVQNKERFLREDIYDILWHSLQHTNNPNTISWLARKIEELILKNYTKKEDVLDVIDRRIRYNEGLSGLGNIGEMVIHSINDELRLLRDNDIEIRKKFKEGW